MITHDTFSLELELGALKVYSVWEIPFDRLVEVKRYYWHEPRCEESIGPFESLFEAMEDYAEVKRKEKALQKLSRVQELQNKEGAINGIRK